MQILLYNNKTKVVEPVDNKDVIDNIYFQKHRVPTDEQLIKFNITSNTIKDSISKLENKIPLYDEYTKNIYIVDRTLVYDKVIYKYHRFPDISVLNELKDRKKKYKKKKSDGASIQGKFYEELYPEKIYNKLKYMIDFLEQYNLDILKDTYIKVFYYHSNSVGKNLTTCVRPSFLPHLKHIKPYYTRSELINLGLNMQIITENNEYYDDKKILSLCSKIKNNDISSTILLDHYKYIIKSEKIGLVQYYTLQGSYFINRYLRDPNMSKNIFLESLIISLTKLINGSPAFDKPYTVYRFIRDDSYLKHLQVGDTYTLNSIESTTRDPFYAKVYQFGFILIKILIPKDIIGVGLSVESLSNFPYEEEILLAPGTQLRLKSKDKNVPYYRTDNIAHHKFITRYEFVYEGKTDTSSEGRSLPKNNKFVNFLKIDKDKNIDTLDERISVFVKKYAGELYQYETLIGDNIYVIMVEWYNSTDIYSDFYAAKTNNGFYMYTMIGDNIGFTMEIGNESGEDYMYVNYYFRFSSTPKNNKIKDYDLIKFITQAAYYFNINTIVLFCEYSSCDFKIDKFDRTYYGGNYCVDFYNYLKHGIKKYTFMPFDLKPQYSFFELDRLKTISIDTLFNEDKDELYQIYQIMYKVNFPDSNISDFYIWIVDNYCIYLEDLLEKINILYETNNPFLKDYYIIDPFSFLYNQQLVDEYSTELDKLKKEFPMNKYRSNTIDNKRVRIRKNRNI